MCTWQDHKVLALAGVPSKDPPPAIRTLPSVSKVAVCPYLPGFICPLGLDVPVEGSYGGIIECGTRQTARSTTRTLALHSRKPIHVAFLTLFESQRAGDIDLTSLL